MKKFIEISSYIFQLINYFLGILFYFFINIKSLYVTRDRTNLFSISSYILLKKAMTNGNNQEIRFTLIPTIEITEDEVSDIYIMIFY